jgi:hypothetical protein
VLLLVLYWAMIIYKEANTEVLLVTIKEIVVDISAQKTKCVFVSWHQNVGQDHNT